MFKDGMVSMIQKAKKMQEDMKVAQEEIKSIRLERSLKQN